MPDRVRSIHELDYDLDGLPSKLAEELEKAENEQLRISELEISYGPDSDMGGIYGIVDRVRFSDSKGNIWSIERHH